MRIGIVTKWLDEAYTGIGIYTYDLINSLLALDKKNNYVFIHRKGGTSDVYKHGEEMFLPKTHERKHHEKVMRDPSKFGEHLKEKLIRSIRK